jgi:nitrite reductase (NADH) small subunit
MHPKWHDLGPAAGFPDRGLEGRRIRGVRLCIGRSGDVHFAIDDTCPHAGGSLSEGLVDGDLVICPLHAYAFEILTGACVDDAHCSVSSYPVRVENGRVEVMI